MDNNINDIDKFFKDRLDGHESAFIPGAWGNMEAMLDADKSGSAVKNINQYILASIAGAIILAGSVVAYISGYQNNTTTYTDNTVTKTEEQVIAQAPIAKQETENIATTPENSAAPLNTDKFDGTTEGTANDSNATNSASTAPTTPTTPTSPAPQASEAPEPTVIIDDTESETPKEVVVESVTIKEAPEYSTTELFTKKSFSNLLLTAVSPKFQTAYPDFADFITSQKLVIDSTQKAERKLDEIQRFYRPQFGIQAGGNFNRVLSNTSDNFQVGSGIMAGLFFSKNFNRQWAINAELNYLRSTGNNISRNITQTDFFLEKTTTNFFLVTKTFDYVQLPVSVSYSVTPKHKFSLGTSAMLLVNAKTEVAEHQERFAEKSSTTVTKNGVYEDLNTMNYGLLLGYEFNLPGKYSLGVRYNQMFNDVSKNSFFNDGKKHLPTHLQLFVKLNLTK